MGEFVIVLCVFVFWSIAAAIRVNSSPKFNEAKKTSAKADSVSAFSRSKIRGLDSRMKKLNETFAGDPENEELQEAREALGTASARQYEINSSGEIKASSRERMQSSRKVKSAELAKSMEDREHDWLAKQLAEERSILRKGNPLDLGASHDRTCDARAVKRLHELTHDDSIDEGEA